MNDHSDVAIGGLDKPVAESGAVEAPPVDAGAGTVLVLAVWIGLLAGFLDLGLLFVNKRLIDRDFFRLGGNFIWIIPAGVTTLVAAPAIVLALIGRIRRKPVRLGFVVAVLSFIGFLDICARLPLELWASLLVCGGLATQAVRVVRTHTPVFLRLVRRTAPLLAGILLTTMLVTIGGRSWSDYRAVSSLPTAPADLQNVLLIVWDTVRAGNLSLHGYGRPTTPNLERLAMQGVRFDLAFSTSSWTLPSHASMFTGRWPHELDVDWKSPLRDDVPTLAEYLSSRGYETAGFAANLDYCSRETGLARGFTHYEDFPVDFYDAMARYVALGHRAEFASWIFMLDGLAEKWLRRRYDLTPPSNEHRKNAEAVDGAFLKWLDRRPDRRRPFFAFLNYNDAHSPYEVPDRSTPGFGLRPDSAADRQTLFLWNSLDKARLSSHAVRMAGDVYDDCISYLDRRLEILLQDLSRRHVLDNTLVIVTSDHGEHLGDHLLFFHGCSLYRQLVQVPLVIVNKKVVPSDRVVAEPVSLRDIPATVIDLLGLPREARFPGRSLSRAWRPTDEGDALHPEPILMETGKPQLLTNQGREPAAKGPMKSVVAAGMHYIRTSDGFEELYMLRVDPEERINQAGSPDARSVLVRFRNLLESLSRKRSPSLTSRVELGKAG